MEKEQKFFKSKIVLGTFVIFGLILGIILGITFNVHNRDAGKIGEELNADSTVGLTGAQVFKQDYESLNGQETTSGEKIKSLNISEDNPIKYISYKKAMSLLTDGNGVIYIGFNSCPWCRNAVPVLLDAAKNTELDTIYYINIKNDSLTTKKDSDGNTVKDEEALQFQLDLANKLYEAGVYDGVGNPATKTIYSPTVIFIKDGKIISYKVGTVDSQTDPYENLTEDQYNELLSFYEENMKKIK